MPGEIKPLAAGLYLVATPIGTARDITLRALDVLASADVLVAEDTRTLRHLMNIHGVAVAGRPVIAYHDHSGASVRARLLQALDGGKSVAYAPEAGTPLVSDPGYQLVQQAMAAGLSVTPVPGPSAVLSALVVAGLPTDRFLFAGFLPPARAARRAELVELAAVPATLVVYESPNRVQQILADMVVCLGGERRAAVCRELTKKFEEVTRGTLAELADRFADVKARGEIVIAVDRGRQAAGEQNMEDTLREALKTMSLKDAATSVAEALGLPRRRVYQAALDMARRS